jgi:molybdenum cofactor cytidylyltransferase
MPEYSTFAIILAAGESQRFGSTKQLANFGNETLVRRAVRLAYAVCGDNTVLVVGNDWQRVLAACGPQRGIIVRNDEYASGMASSIASGVASVAKTADAVLLLLADQPLITEKHLCSLIDEWHKAPDGIVASEYSDVQGPPVIFPASCFGRLMKLEGDQGARALLNEPDCPLTGIEFGEGAIDIDTPEDLAGLTKS